MYLTQTNFRGPLVGILLWRYGNFELSGIDGVRGSNRICALYGFFWGWIGLASFRALLFFLFKMRSL